MKLFKTVVRINQESEGYENWQSFNNICDAYVAWEDNLAFLIIFLICSSWKEWAKKEQ